MFFPGEDEDVEMNEPAPASDPSTIQINRRIALSGVSSRPDAPFLLSSKAQTLIPTSPRQDSHLSEEVGNQVREPASRSPPHCQSPRPSQSGDAGLPATAVHTLEESVSRPVRIREELYKIVSQVGEGTFGKVYKAQNTVSRLFVALKRIRMEGERDGFPVTAMREIKLLQSLRHPNIVNLHEMMVSKGQSLSNFDI